AADENRHLRRRQPQQLRPVYQRFFRQHELLLAADKVAEAVSTRFKRREGFDVGLLLRRIHAARREGNLHVVPGRLRGLLDGGTAAEDDQIGERDFLAPSVALLLDRLELLQDGLELSRLVDLPVLLRREANARAVRSATLVGAAERRRRRPGGRNELGNRQAGRENLCLQRGDLRLSDQRV